MPVSESIDTGAWSSIAVECVEEVVETERGKGDANKIKRTTAKNQLLLLKDLLEKLNEDGDGMGKFGASIYTHLSLCN